MAKFDWHIPEEEEVDIQIELPPPLKAALSKAASTPEFILSSKAIESSPDRVRGRRIIENTTSKIGAMTQRSPSSRSRSPSAERRQSLAGGESVKGDVASASSEAEPSQLYPPEQVSPFDQFDNGIFILHIALSLRSPTLQSFINLSVCHRFYYYPCDLIFLFLACHLLSPWYITVCD